MCKVCRVSQGHLEIGLHEWRKIINPYFTTRQPAVKFFSQLTGTELDEIITAMEAVKPSKTAPPTIVDVINSDISAPEPVQTTFW